MSGWIQDLSGWIQQELDLSDYSPRQLIIGGSVLLVIGLMSAQVVADSLHETAKLEAARADGERRGRLELLQQIDRAVEQEGSTWQAYYRAASQPGLSGFDGLMLSSNCARK